MQIAIQEKLLPGASPSQRLEWAQAQGCDGVEFDADGLTARVPELIDRLKATGLQTAAINTGGTHLLHPDYAQREAAIVYIRQAMADSLDLNAAGVVFIPTHRTTPRLPDLHPYKSAIELEAEMLVTQLRATLCDLAYAMGAMLFLQPANRAETPVVRRLDHAAVVLRKNDDHPHLMIAPHSQHMAWEEDDPMAALHAQAERIGYVHLDAADDPAPLITILREIGYDGWLTLTADQSLLPEAITKALRRVRDCL